MAHILHIVDNLNVGGAQRLLVTLARGMQGQRHHMSVLNLHRIDALADDIRAQGVEVVTIPAKLTDPRRLTVILNAVRRLDADVIHTHLGGAHTLGALCGRLLGIPVVASLHSVMGGTPGRLEERIRRGLEHACLRHLADRLVAVGPRVATDWAAGFDARRIHTIENAVAPPLRPDPEARAATRRTLMGTADRMLFIAVGRLSVEKGYGDLLEAFARIRATGLDAALAIVGDGDQRQTVADRAAALGIADRVLLLGTRGDVAELLAAADVFVMSSHWEGLPVALLEGMAAGLPVVSTAVGDIPTVVDARCGLLVEPHAPGALAEAMLTLAADPDRRATLGRAAQAIVAERFALDHWVEKLCALYDDVLDAPGRPAGVPSAA